MSVSVQSVLKRASTLLLDLGMERWTEDELLMWLNDGQRELAASVKPDAKVRTIEHVLNQGAKQAVPADGLAILDVRQNKDGTAITPCERSALDRFSPSWMQKPLSSSVRHWMPDEHPNVFYVYPAQNDAPGTVVMTYSAQPATVGAADDIDVRDIYAENLLNFILYRAFLKDAEFGGNGERAVAFYQAFRA